MFFARVEPRSARAQGKGRESLKMAGARPAFLLLPACGFSPQAGRDEGEAYRSANASLAPSAAKPAAKLRRSQAMTRGREMTRSRTDAAQRP